MGNGSGWFAQVFLQKFVQRLQQEMIPLEVVDRSGHLYTTAPGRRAYRLLIRDSRFYRALISPNAYTLGQAYIKGYFDVSGSIQELYKMVWDTLLSTRQSRPWRSFFLWLTTPVREWERKNIQYHYDVPSTFFREFLGHTMGYTCGYYAGPDTTMAQAQEAKMEIICQKLRLEKGDHLLDIGCGWGNFAVYAACHYPVQVTGITLSQEQKQYADQWIRAQNLSDRIEIRILNYRDLGNEQYDKISCIGMSEHVGRKNIPGFFARVYQSLKENGLFLQHTITTLAREKKRKHNRFLDTYMFPGGELMFEQDLIDIASRSGLELIHGENFRGHYVRTLADWIQRMEERRDRLLDLVSEEVFRIFHVFFIGSLIAFEQKKIALFQNLFTRSAPGHVNPDHFLSPFSKDDVRAA